MSKWEHADHKDVLADLLARAKRITPEEMRLARLEREQRRVPFPLKKWKPKIKRMESPRMRAVGSQTKNPIAAAYKPDRIPTPVRKNRKGLTRQVGPLDPIVKSQYTPGKGGYTPNSEGR